MMKVNKINIEKLFLKANKEFFMMDYSKRMEFLEELERKATMYNNEPVSEMSAIKISFEKIKYYFSRIYCEGKNLRGFTKIKRYLDFIEYGIEHPNKYYGCEDNMKAIKDALTYLEISMNLDVTFYTSLFDIYKHCMEKEKETQSVNFYDIQKKYNDGGYR